MSVTSIYHKWIKTFKVINSVPVGPSAKCDENNVWSCEWGWDGSLEEGSLVTHTEQPKCCHKTQSHAGGKGLGPAGQCVGLPSTAGLASTWAFDLGFWENLFKEETPCPRYPE